MTQELPHIHMTESRKAAIMDPLFYQSDKVAAFIDGSNLYAAIKSIEGFDMDYSKLVEWLRGTGKLVRVNYYTAITDDGEGFSSITPLVDYLDYNGYNVIKKAAKVFHQNGHEKIKGNVDVELAVDMLEAADHADHIILFSGDGDFRRLVEAVQRKGVRVTVISTLKSNQPMVADELRRQADAFIDLDVLRHIVNRAVNRRPDLVSAEVATKGYGQMADAMRRAGEKSGNTLRARVADKDGNR